MNFTDAVGRVLAISKRPDKLEEVRDYVNAALTFCCLNANFARDLVEMQVDIDPAQYTQSVLLSSFAGFRKFKYMRPNAVGAAPIDPLDPDRIFDAKGREEVNKYYIAGDNVVFKMSGLAPTLLVGYYKLPPYLTDASPTHWLLDAVPLLVVYKAVGEVFASIGDDASSKNYEGRFQQLWTVAKSDLQDGVALA